MWIICQINKYITVACLIYKLYVPIKMPSFMKLNQRYAHVLCVRPMMAAADNIKRLKEYGQPLITGGRITIK